MTELQKEILRNVVVLRLTQLHDVLQDVFTQFAQDAIKAEMQELQEILEHI